MHDELVKSLRQCAKGSCAGCKNDLVQIGCRRKLQREAADVIEELTAADVRPVVRGEWEKTEDFDEYGGGRYVEWTCSVCFSKAKGGWAVRDEHIDEPPAWNFCPNCGADMREEPR